MPGKKAMFEGPGVLEAFCEKIVLPNMVLRSKYANFRSAIHTEKDIAFEEEMFEDDANEYVRRDLMESAGGKPPAPEEEVQCDEVLACRGRDTATIRI